MAQIIALNPIFERVSTPVKKFDDVIVFVHHYGGHKFSFKKHIQWVNELGYDAVTFDLPLTKIYDVRLYSLPISKSWSFGLRHVWADKIEEVLGYISEKKIIYSFSSPSASALTAIANRNAVDVTAWVCDGGPFTNFTQGIENLVSHQNPLNLNRFPQLRHTYANFLSLAAGSRHYDKDMGKALSTLPKKFPILSVRALADKLVSVDMIDQFFALSPSTLNLTKINLLNSGHLTGLKDEPDFYKKNISAFLQTTSAYR